MTVPRLLLGLALAIGLSALAGRTSAQGFRVPGERPLADVLQIVALDGELVALDAFGGSGPRERLEIDEQLLYYETRGRVGVAVTDRRLLAVGVGSGAWQDTRYRHGERPPTELLLGDRVALAVTAKRALGFDAGSGNLVEQSLGPREQLRGFEVGGNVGVVVTDRRVLGLSPFTGGFFTRRIRLSERIEAIEARGNFATVRTSRRLLTFRAPSGSWGERARNLR